MARVKNSIRNISFSLVSQLATTVLSLVLRTVLIETLGLESVSLKTLFHEIVSVLALSELGIGSAISFNMIKPLKDGDREKVRQLMNFYKKAYRFIALTLFVLGLLVCFFVQHLVTDITIDVWYLRLIFMLYVSQSALSYLLSYKATLLHCDQKGYIAAKLTTTVKVIGTLAMIGLLLLTKNFVLYIIAEIILTLAVNVTVSVKVDQIYPYAKGDGKLPKEEQKKVFDNVKNIFFKSMAGKVVGSTDNMLISTLVSTIVVGYYGNYNTIVAVFRSLMDSAGSGIDASLGHLYVDETPQKCDQVLGRLTYGFFAATAIFTVGTFNCIQPFVSLWIGAEYLLPEITVVLICLTVLLYIMVKPISSAMHYSGMFAIGRNISIISALINLTVSILLGYWIGLNGILIGTVCVYVFEACAKTYYLYTRFLKRDPKPYFWRMVSYIFGVIILMLLPQLLTGLISFDSKLLQFLFNGAVSVAITGMLVYFCSRHTEHFRYYKELAENFIHKKREKSA